MWYHMTQRCTLTNTHFTFFFFLCLCATLNLCLLTQPNKPLTSTHSLMHHIFYMSVDDVLTQISTTQRNAWPYPRSATWIYSMEMSWVPLVQALPQGHCPGSFAHTPSAKISAAALGPLISLAQACFQLYLFCRCHYFPNPSHKPRCDGNTMLYYKVLVNGKQHSVNPLITVVTEERTQRRIWPHEVLANSWNRLRLGMRDDHRRRRDFGMASQRAGSMSTGTWQARMQSQRKAGPRLLHRVQQCVVLTKDFDIWHTRGLAPLCYIQSTLYKCEPSGVDQG